MKYNNELKKAILMLTESAFTYPEMPQGMIEMDKEGNKVITKPNHMEVPMWCRRWEATNKIENEYKKYQKTAYPLVLGQCSLALQAQLEGTKSMTWET